MNPGAIENGLAILQGLLFLALVIVAALTDVRSGKIDNRLCFAGVLAGLTLGYMRGGFNDPEAAVTFASSAAACVVGFAVLFVFYLARGLGAGDVKLMAAVGALSGSPLFMLWAITATAFAGLPIAVATLFARGDVKGGLRRSLKSVFRLRAAPAVAESAVGSKETSETKTADEATGSNDSDGSDDSKTAESPEAPITIPYAVPICLGSLMTIWLYLDRGAALPFLTG